MHHYPKRQRIFHAPLFLYLKSAVLVAFYAPQAPTRFDQPYFGFHKRPQTHPILGQAAFTQLTRDTLQKVFQNLTTRHEVS